MNTFCLTAQYINQGGDHLSDVVSPIVHMIVSGHTPDVSVRTLCAKRLQNKTLNNY